MEDKVALDEEINIFALERKYLRNCFLNETNEPEYCVKLIEWFKTKSWPSKEERATNTYVVIKHGLLVGYFTIQSAFVDCSLPVEPTYCDVSKPQLLQLCKLYIAKDFRDGGIGSFVIKYVIDIARTLDSLTGCAGIIVDSNHNEKTLNFYKNNKFIVIEESTEEDDVNTIKLYFNTRI